MYSDSYISIPHVLTTFMVFFSHKPLQGSTRVLNPLVLNMGSSSTDIGRTPSEYTTSWHQVTYPYDLLYTCGHDPMRPNIFSTQLELTPLHVVPSTPSSLQGRLVQKVNESDMAETVKARGDGVGDLVEKTLIFIVKHKRCRQKIVVR